MEWSVEATDEFVAWWDTLDDSAKGSIDAYVRLLEDQGPQLPFPYSSGIEGSRHGRMRELRVQSKGDPLRVFYAFDPKRTAILLIGGNKAGNDEFYREMIPVADRLYDEHLADIGQDDKGSRRK
jgi:hypothetical protein